MKRFYTLLLSTFLLSTINSQAQCPTPNGMVGTPVSLSGSCFINIQFAIPNSNVSIYNASGFVAQGTANASGNVIIPYPCSANPITSILSMITTPTVQICNTSTITQAIVLPVKLSGFAAALTNRGTVLLKWETAMELDNEKFVIQRSTDGVNYQTVSEVAGSGSSVEKRSYSYDDASFPAGSAVFYRLKQVDNDGRASYSQVVYISDKKSGGTVTAFPNPLTGTENTIQLKGVSSKDVTYSNIRITDISGKNIAFRITGANAIEPQASLAPGLYIIRVKDQVVKLLKN